jgi:hypothetical protein
MPSTYTGPAIPKKEAECQGIPASTEAPGHLVMALGLLRRFDAEQNNALPNQSPQCSFLNNPIMKGVYRLDHHGPLGFEVLYAAALGLGGLFQSHVCDVTDAKGVGTALGTKLTMYVILLVTFAPPHRGLTPVDVGSEQIAMKLVYIQRGGV